MFRRQESRLHKQNIPELQCNWYILRNVASGYPIYIILEWSNFIIAIFQHIKMVQLWILFECVKIIIDIFIAIRTGIVCAVPFRHELCLLVYWISRCWLGKFAPIKILKLGRSLRTLRQQSKQTLIKHKNHPANSHIHNILCVYVNVTIALWAYREKCTSNYIFLLSLLFLVGVSTFFFIHFAYIRRKYT